MRDVASKSMYGAFGVPIALLLWINLSAKLLLVCAAWTATPSKDGRRSAEDGDGEGDGDGAGRDVSGAGGGAPGPAAASAG
jgi:membrane protein